MTAKTIANKNFPIPNEGRFRSGSLLSMAVMLRHHCNRTARYGGQACLLISGSRFCWDSVVPDAASVVIKKQVRARHFAERQWLVPRTLPRSAHNPCRRWRWRRWGRHCSKVAR